MTTRTSEGSDDQATLPRLGKGRGIRFCSYCGALQHAGRLGGERVCNDCTLGVLLTTSPEALPGPGAAFVIVTGDLRVSAASGRAERLFETTAPISGWKLLDTVRGLDGDQELLTCVARAAGGARGVTETPVVLAVGREKHSRSTARIATCGPPRAALVTILASD